MCNLIHYRAVSFQSIIELVRIWKESVITTLSTVKREQK
jgi:oligoribonuclease (3'-5' exoribonuclease)